MAVIYLRSTDGNDADDGSTWALAKATLAAALTAAGAGGTVYVSQAHAETQASAMALTSPGTPSAAVNVVCVDDGAAPPTTLATSARVITSGANAITFSGHAYSFGVQFESSTGSATAHINIGLASNSCGWVFDTGKLSLLNTNLGGRINVGTGSSPRDQGVLLINTPVKFGNVSQCFTMNGKLQWKSTPSAIDTTAVTVLFSGGNWGDVVASGVDLSTLSTGKSLVNVASNSTAQYLFANCKLGGSVSIVTGAIAGWNGIDVVVDNCDSSDTNYRMEHYKYQGSIKSETSKTCSGGASDGTTSLSWNMTSLAGASFVSPLESPQFVIWNDTTGSAKTVTVEVAQDSAATALTDGEIWLEVEYLGTSGYPISSTATDRKSNILASAANQTTSSATWNNMTTPTKQKLEVTFTPQEKGFFQCRVMLAKPSVTVYVDPMATVS